MKKIAEYDTFPDLRQSRVDTCILAATAAVLQFLGHGSWTEDSLARRIRQRSFEGVRDLIQSDPLRSKLVATIGYGTPEEIVESVKRSIDNDAPVLLSKDANVGADHAHIVVALGYDDDTLIVHDPGPGRGKGTPYSYEALISGPDALKRDYLTIKAL